MNIWHTSTLAIHCILTSLLLFNVLLLLLQLLQLTGGMLDKGIVLLLVTLMQYLRELGMYFVTSVSKIESTAETSYS